ncbi:MAG: DUF5722 domain-containing protein [Candidatus Microbacterium stercoravium]
MTHHIHSLRAGDRHDQTARRRRRPVAGALAVLAAMATSVLSPSAALAEENPEWTFDTPGDTQGWAAGSGVPSLEATERGLEVQVEGQDPWIASPDFALDAETVNTVEIDAENATGNAIGKIYWQTEDEPVWSEGMAQTFELRPDETEPSEYRVDLRGISSWDGTITKLRIDPGDNATSEGIVTITSIGFDFNKEELPNPEDEDRDPVEHVGHVDPITATDSELLVTGATDESAEEYRLYELDAWEYETDVDDAELLDAHPASSGDFSFAVPRFDGERDRLTSKFLVVAATGDEVAYVDSARYATELDFAAKNDFEFPEPPTKKGLQVQMTDDAEELGVGHAAINIAFDQLLQPEDLGSDKSIPFTYDGETYYFDREYAAASDQAIKPLSDNDMLVNLILIVYDNEKSNPGAPDLLIHPDAARGQGTVYAFNTVDENSRYFRATLAFLAERYSQEDESHGRAVGWIVGNEVNSPWAWQNQGEATVNTFMDDYERAMRWTYLETTREYDKARTYISLDHFWNGSLNPAQPYRYYGSRDLIDRLQELTEEAGDFPWNVAQHPYPEDLFDPAVWNDETATDSFDTMRITFKNLQVLSEYLGQEQFLDDGELRHIILSEQGFNTPDDSEEAAELQAAAYAYGYYRAVSTPGIDSFILHRHVDYKTEGGLRLGLWTWDDESEEDSSPDEKKPIYDVFRYIDTVEGAEHTAFAPEIIGEESWEGIFPGLDIEAQGTRPLPEEMPTSLSGSGDSGDETEVRIPLANDAWVASDNATGVQQTDDGVMVDFAALDKLWRGIVQSAAEPIAATDAPLLQVGIDVPGTDAESDRVAKVKVYAGDEVAFGTAELTSEHSDVTVDLGDWDRIDAIERIKVWVRGSSNADWDGTFTVTGAGFAAEAPPSEEPEPEEPGEPGPEEPGQPGPEEPGQPGPEAPGQPEPEEPGEPEPTEPAPSQPGPEEPGQPEQPGQPGQPGPEDPGGEEPEPSEGPAVAEEPLSPTGGDIAPALGAFGILLLVGGFIAWRSSRRLSTK